MSDFCTRTMKDKRLVRKLRGSGIGVPSAPIFRKFTRNVEYIFEMRKLELGKRLPVYNYEEVRRLRSPQWVLVIDTLIDNGYHKVVEEIGIILRKQEVKIHSCESYSQTLLKFQKENFTRLAETLKFCSDLDASGRIEHSVTLRKDFAVNVMNDGELWLAKHLLLVALRQIMHVESMARIQAEIHCILGFIGTLDCGNQEVALEEAISHLIKCRQLSRDEVWHFRPNVLSICIKRPVHLVGLRNDVTTVDGNSLPIYLVASLLEHQLMVLLVNRMLFSAGVPTHEEVGMAITYANDALQLAFDVRQPEALCSALIRFGNMLRDTGNVEEAVEYFDQVQVHSELRRDKETEALAFYGLATCFLARREPVHALEMFVVQKETAEEVVDVGAEAMQGIGSTLMSEGQTVEARECFGLSLRDFIWSSKILGTPHRWSNQTWALDGLIRGQDIWGRFAGLARQKVASDLNALVKFKNSREPLPNVQRPAYDISKIRRMDKFEGGEGYLFDKSEQLEENPDVVMVFCTNFGFDMDEELMGEDGDWDLEMDPRAINEKMSQMSKQQPWMPTPTASRTTSAKTMVWKAPSTRMTVDYTEEGSFFDDVIEYDIDELRESDSIDLFDVDLKYASDRDYDHFDVQSISGSNLSASYSIRRTKRGLRDSPSGVSPFVSVGSSRRLPPHIVPDSYLICLKPKWDQLTIEGCEIIHLSITAESREVYMHAIEIKVAKIMWEEDVTQNRQEPLEYVMDEDLEMLKIIFEPPLNPSTGYLRINFGSNISTSKAVGFYRCNEPPEGFFTLVSSLEPASARRVFPCWDEPGIFATFEISVVTPKGLTVVSNMPQKAQYAHRSKKSLHIIEFMQSPPMPAYLLCICIGKLEFRWRCLADHFTLRFFADKEKRPAVEYPLDIAAELVPFFTNYLEVPFPLPKLDFVALPLKLRDGTENWGAITARELNVLAEGKQADAFEQNLHLLLSYLIAQQWVGNMVGIKWYNYLWLNKGLAAFMQHLAVDQLAPQFEIWSQFIYDSTIKALEVDSSKTARALEANIVSPADITDAIEKMAARKGASLIRMLYKYLGPEDFQKGLKYFLTEYQNEAVTSTELWQAMEEATEKPVEAIFNSWVRNPGFPLIKVSAKQEGNYRIFTIQQEKFYADPATKEVRTVPTGYRDSKEPIWSIPITFASPHKPELHKVVLERRTTTVQVLIGKAQWVNVNPGHFGFYRVRYSPECFTQFLPSVRQKALPVIDRLTLLSDLYALVQNGLSSSVELLSVLEAFADETHYSVWKLICDMFVKMDMMLDGLDFHRKFVSFAKFILSNVEDKTKWEAKENEGHLMNLRRPIILSTLVALGHDPTLHKAQKLFDLSTRGEAKIPEDVRTLVYKAVLGSAEEEVVRQFLKMYREADSLEEKERVANSYGGIKDEEHLKIILDFSISDDVKVQHTVNILTSLASSKSGRDLAWAFFKEHWSLFRHRYAGSTLMTTLVKSVTEHFASEEKAIEILDFFKEHHIPGVDSVVQLSCEGIRIKEAWIKRDSNFIQDYLSTYA